MLGQVNLFVLSMFHVSQPISEHASASDVRRTGPISSSHACSSNIVSASNICPSKTVSTSNICPVKPIRTNLFILFIYSLFIVDKNIIIQCTQLK